MRALVSALFLLAAPAHAECIGQNILDAMPPERRAQIEAAANSVPYPSGNFWTAAKGDARLTLIGTYHLDDPRHDAIVQAVGPLIDAASTVLVEGGPEEEAALKDRMGRDPSVMILQDTTLPEILPPEDWAMLSDALRKRDIPPFMAAKFQPWFISVMLAMPTCKMDGMTQPRGLDARIVERATASGVAIRALEPYDTVFSIFDVIPFDDQISLIRSTLAMEDRADDYAITLSDTYFNGRSRLIWELMRFETAALPGYTPEKTEAEFAVMEEAMMSGRNRNWIPVIEAAAARGPVVAAFGALHLSGHDGVLDLLNRAGWTLTPFPLTP